MKKFGHFLLIFVPLILSNVIQYLAVFFCMGFTCLIESCWYIFSATADIYDVISDLDYLLLSSDYNAYVMIIYTSLTLVVFGLWYYMRYEGNYRPHLRSTFHPLTILGVVMLMPGMQYLSSYIVDLTATLVPKWLEQYEELMESAGLDETFTLGLFLYSVIFAPLSEELIFRGVTMRQARRILPFWAANIIQAVLFGIFHMNWIQGIYAACLGLILGYVCERGGSIYHSILLHMLFNFWAAVLSEYTPAVDTTFSYLFWFFFGLVMTIGGLFSFIIGTKKCDAIRVASSTPSEMQ